MCNCLKYKNINDFMEHCNSLSEQEIKKVVAVNKSILSTAEYKLYNFNSLIMIKFVDQINEAVLLCETQEKFVIEEKYVSKVSESLVNLGINITYFMDNLLKYDSNNVNIEEEDNADELEDLYYKNHVAYSTLAYMLDVVTSLRDSLLLVINNANPNEGIKELINENDKLMIAAQIDENGRWNYLKCIKSVSYWLWVLFRKVNTLSSDIQYQ